MLSKKLLFLVYKIGSLKEKAQHRDDHKIFPVCECIESTDKAQSKHEGDRKGKADQNPFKIFPIRPPLRE